MMKTIKLTKGKSAIVDDDDFERLSKFRWHLGNRYATRSYGPRKNQRKVRMHREILGLEEGVGEVDHINGNRLDNRKANLRVVSHRENMANNRRASKYGTGVQKNNNCSTFSVRVIDGSRSLYVGSYRTPVEARAARNDFLRRLDFVKKLSGK